MSALDERYHEAIEHNTKEYQKLSKLTEGCLLANPEKINTHSLYVDLFTMISVHEIIKYQNSKDKSFVYVFFSYPYYFILLVNGDVLQCAFNEYECAFNEYPDQNHENISIVNIIYKNRNIRIPKFYKSRISHNQIIFSYLVSQNTNNSSNNPVAIDIVNHHGVFLTPYNCCDYISIHSSDYRPIKDFKNIDVSTKNNDPKIMIEDVFGNKHILKKDGQMKTDDSSKSYYFKQITGSLLISALLWTIMKPKI